MGRRELLDALRREGQEALADIAAKGVAEEKRLRTVAEERLCEQRQEHEHQCELLCNDRKRTLIAEAVRESSLIRLRSEHGLSLRLYERARILLKQLRCDDSGRQFRALAAELPVVPWQTVWVSPADTILAASHVPGATIVSDDAVAGGIKAVSADGSLSVDNTLETRLERVWPDLLPQLMAELRGDPQ